MGELGGPWRTESHQRLAKSTNFDPAKQKKKLDSTSLAILKHFFFSCGQTESIEKVKASILKETGVPRCRLCGGYIKPDIVFFGENLPDRFFRFKESDTDKTDLLVCIGTSLEVYPFAGLADEILKDTPRILINREVVGTFGYRENDVILTGDLVENVDKLAKLLGYEINQILDS